MVRKSLEAKDRTITRSVSSARHSSKIPCSTLLLRTPELLLVEAHRSTGLPVAGGKVSLSRGGYTALVSIVLLLYFKSSSRGTVFPSPFSTAVMETLLLRVHVSSPVNPCSSLSSLRLFISTSAHDDLYKQEQQDSPPISIGTLANPNPVQERVPQNQELTSE